MTKAEIKRKWDAIYGNRVRKERLKEKQAKEALAIYQPKHRIYPDAYEGATFNTHIAHTLAQYGII